MNDKLTQFPMPDFMVQVDTFDKEGNRTNHLKEQGHSWTRNGWMLNFAFMSGVPGDDTTTFGPGARVFRRFDGNISSAESLTVQVASSSIGGGAYIINSSSDTSGIIIGTSSTAFDINDSALHGKILGGSGSGQMVYIAQTWPQASYNATSKIWTVTNNRQFSNQSGGSIDVNEIGMVWRGRAFNSTLYPLLVARDVLSSTQTVADGEVLSVDYITTFDFSSID